MDILAFFHFIGQAICHQIPERSFFINGVQMPICIRDTGIYLGIFSSLFVLFVTKRHRANMIPRRGVSLALLLLLIPMVYDGITAYLGLRETKNLLRLVTGIPFGVVLPLFVVPLINIRQEQRNINKITPKIIDVFLALGIAAAISTFFYTGLIEGIILAAILTIIVFVWFFLIVSLVLKVIGWREPNTWRHITAGGATAITLVTLSLLFQPF